VVERESIHLVAQVDQPLGAAVVARASAWSIVKVKPVAGPSPVADSVNVVAVGVPTQATVNSPNLREAAGARHGVVKVPTVA
jgi:hypothetical protein